MSAPASSPDSFRPLRTAQGTIVGMPPVVRHALDPLCSTTLRSVYRPAAADEAPCSDAFHPERWSNPPAAGLVPIVPCAEPDEEDGVQLRPKLELTPAPVEPAAEVEVEPPTQRWEPTVVAVALLNEPVELPVVSHRWLWPVLTAGVALVLVLGATLLLFR
ncbi:MAG: hypothetical protein HYZ29_17060 [Myxococcales bacterium]|nr:hypothetical protein [Myxococcales bacterium]